MAPGKSVPLPMASSQDEDMRRSAWKEWITEQSIARLDKLQTVLKAAGRLP